MAWLGVEPTPPSASPAARASHRLYIRRGRTPDAAELRPTRANCQTMSAHRRPPLPSRGSTSMVCAICVVAVMGVSVHDIKRRRLRRAAHHGVAAILEIADDGHGNGAVSSTPEGVRLIGMRERAALLGGQLRAGPLAGGGFAVLVMLPTPAGAR
jgi:hypothetical protein